jgi:signal peptidase I
MSVMEENPNEINEESTFEGTAEKTKKKSAKREMLEWVEAIVAAVLIAFVIRTFIMTVVRVDGQSMENTLYNNERLIVWRLGYEPENDDIIIFEPRCAQGSYYVKRVIATEGQTVKIDYDTNSVYVDGEKIDEPYIKEEMSLYMFSANDDEWTVPEDCVFVMGDNRNHSSDSRNPDVGFVTKDSILGKVVLRFWPLNTIGLVK